MARSVYLQSMLQAPWMSLLKLVGDWVDIRAFIFLVDGNYA